MGLRAAVCHPGRKSVNDHGYCRRCLGEEAERQATEAPGPVIGVVQHILFAPPTECPKCQSRFLLREGRRISCAGIYGGCGWDGFLIGARPVKQPRREVDHYLVGRPSPT